MKKVDVLLTDGNYKHTYAALRNLCNHNISTAVICRSKFDVCYWSKYPAVKILCKGELGKDALFRIIEKYNPEVVLPIGIGSVKAIIENKDEISLKTKILVPPKESFNIAFDKNRTFSFAKSIGLAIPETYEIERPEDINKIKDKIRFPVVVKSSDSSVKSICYCNDFAELLVAVKPNFNFFFPPIIQEKICGPGVGYFGLYQKGQPIAEFMHERVHEYPVSGGISACAKSIFDSKLQDISRMLLEKLKWDGVVMVEFKYNKESDQYYLIIEINPKYWGSLELGICSGVPFPLYHYLLSREDTEVFNIDAYKQDVYFSWEYPYEDLWKRVLIRKNELNTIYC